MKKLKQQLLLWVVATLTSKEFVKTVQTLVRSMMFSHRNGDEKRKIVANDAKRIARQHGEQFSDNLVNLAIEAIVYLAKNELEDDDGNLY